MMCSVELTVRLPRRSRRCLTGWPSPSPEDTATGVVTAVQISKATMPNVWQNLAGAFAYNSLGLPIALGVLYPFFSILLSPLLAAAAMSFSSVTVIANANRLKRFTPKEVTS